MKKEYIKPELEEQILFTESLMLGASETPADDSPALGRNRRGSWGNLWDDED